MPRILVATTDGLHELDDRAVPEGVHHTGRAVTTVVQWEKQLWAIVDGTELWHTAEVDGWTHLSDLEPYQGTCLGFMKNDVLVGSSEARLFRLVGDSLEPVAAFDRAEGRSTWYTPWGGPPDTRSISEWDDAVYVNVHVGGVLRTEDGGETWAPTIDIDADVHQVTTAEGMVLAACADGLAVSTDRGATWSERTDGLEHLYARAVTVCGDTLLMSASKGPRGGEAAVYRAPLAGGAFERCHAGVPDWFDDNIDSHCLDSPPDGSFAAFGTSEGRLFASTDQGSTWTEIATGLPAVNRVLVLP
jgi:hypothetical protein